MSFVLLVIGLLAAAIGAIMVGFGIPINEFSLGNTLIIAGTTALMGGLIVIGLALALRQLGNMAAALAARPGPVVARPGQDAVEAGAPGNARPRMPIPVPARGEASARAPRAPEPRMIAEPPMLEEHEAPLSPRPAARPAPASSDESVELPSWRPPRPAAGPQLRKAGPEAPRVLPPEHRGTEASYDAIWPADGRIPPPERAESHEPRPSEVAPSELPAPGSRTEPVSVLKSGVVDGMAYTLYTDGSIEAELAQGVVRFGSIEELRNHLEKSA